MDESNKPDELIKLVRTYRFTAGLAERLQIADQIFQIIGPDLHLFVFSRIQRPIAEDVFNEVLAAIAKGLKNFKGDNGKQFLKWCYVIAFNKVSDQKNEYKNERLVFESPEDLLQIEGEREADDANAAQTKHDLEYAMKLLRNSKPECEEFLWNHFIFGFEYAEIAGQQNMTYDGVRMKIGRCLEEAKRLVS